MSVATTLLLLTGLAAPAFADPNEPSVVPDGCHPELATQDGYDAVQLNTAGFRCYNEKNYGAAHDLFKASVANDDAYALAHYNLACTLALLRRSNQICDYQAYLDDVLHHLERAVALDPRRRDRMRTDKDLTEARTTVRYHLLDGADIHTEAGLAKVLPQLRFFTPPMGVYGSLTTLQMQPAGQIGGQVLAFDDDGVPTGYEPTGGTWSLEGTTIVITLGDTHRYTLDDAGSLVDITDGTVVYVNLPDDCSA